MGCPLSSRHQLQGIAASSLEQHCKGRGTSLSSESEALGGQEVAGGTRERHWG